MKIFIISAIITIVIFEAFVHLMDFLCKESEDEKRKREENEKNKDVATRRVEEDLKTIEVFPISAVIFISTVLIVIFIPIYFTVQYFIG